MTEGSSLPSATEVRQKDRELVLINASTQKRKETRNIPLKTLGNPRNEVRRGTEEKYAKTAQPKKGNSVKRNRNREDPSEHEITDVEMNIEEKVLRKVKKHYRNMDCIVVFRFKLIRNKSKQY